MTDFARLVLDADTRGLKKGERDLDSLGQQSRKTAGTVDRDTAAVAKSFSRLGIAATAAATAAVGALSFFAKSSVQTAIDAQEMQSAFDVVFGSMADNVRAWAEETGNAMGRSTQELQRGALAFQELFGKALDPAKSAELSKQFAVLTQDLASFKNLSNEVAQQKLFSGLIGEAEPLRQVGVFLNEAAVKAKAAELGFKGVNGALTDQEKIIARAALIQEQLAAAQGDVARTSDSAANRIKAAQAAYEELQVTVGNALLPTFTALVQRVGGAIETLNGMASTLGITANGVNTLINVVSSAVGGWLAYRATLLVVTAAQFTANSAFGLTMATIISTTRAVGVGAGAQVAYAAATSAAATAARGLTAALIANPFTAVAVAVGVLTSAIITLTSSQRQARVETDNLIRSLNTLQGASATAIVAKKQELQLELFKAEAEERALKRAIELKRAGSPVTGNAIVDTQNIKAAEALLARASNRVTEFKTAVAGADKLLGQAAQKTATLVGPPIAEVVTGIGNAAAAAAPKTDEFGNKVTSLMDRLFPATARLREYREEFDLLLKAGADQDAFRRLGQEFLDAQFGKRDPVLSTTGAFIDPESFQKQGVKVLRELDVFAKKTTTQTVRIERNFKDMAEGILGSLQNLANGIRGGGILNILGGVLDLLLQLGGAGVFGKGIQTNINKPAPSNRALGGPVKAGSSYIVGERGRERFIPSTDGRIVANDNAGKLNVSITMDPSTGMLGALVRNEAGQVVAQSLPIAAQAGADLAGAQGSRRQSRTVRR